MALISVIIPVYNGKKTIRETIQSVLNQTLGDFELIIINDGSTDSTLEIVSEIQDSRLRVFTYPNAGLAASRNRGIAQATGEFIAFIDADDLWTPDKLEMQLKSLKENPQAAVSYSWTDYIDETSQFIRPGSHISVTGDVYDKLLLINFVENGSNPLIRKEALSEVGGFDESLPSTEDWDMWLRLAKHYRFTVVPYPQVLYRVYAGSMSGNIFQMELTCLRVIENAFIQAPESLQHLKKYSLANIYKYLTYKALQEPPVRKRGLAALKLIGYGVKYDPTLLRRRIIWKVLLRIFIIVALPTKQAQVLLTKFKKLVDIFALLALLQLDVI